MHDIMLNEFDFFLYKLWTTTDKKEIKRYKQILNVLARLS